MVVWSQCPLRRSCSRRRTRQGDGRTAADLDVGLLSSAVDPSDGRQGGKIASVLALGFFASSAPPVNSVVPLSGDGGAAAVGIDGSILPFNVARPMVVFNLMTRFAARVTVSSLLVSDGYPYP
ncbi:unnamed protein product [Linum trigynum]|uniref:Uncharacterized protein n=1 Tax=Linum trigynum TaxID=586398 RepID=A0AAV2FPS4_9ROSI